MNGEVVARIAVLAQEAQGMLDKVAEIDGETYATKGLVHMPKYFPAPVTVELHTLTGFMDIIAAEISKAHEYRIVINNYQSVSLISDLDKSPDKDKRHILYETSPPNFQGFPFGSWLDAESFSIKARSLFVINPDLERLLAYIGNIVTEESVQTTDDGITQKAVMKKGTSGAVMVESKIPSLFALKPYRTFPEIKQPESDFLFRIKTEKDMPPAFALFEADGGLWQIVAIEIIKSFLKDVNPRGIVIIA